MKLKIRVNSKEQTPFWIRVFKLENEIEQVRKMMEKPGPRKWASVPVINEFYVDKDLEFVYVLLFTVDAVGAQACIGMVFLCDREDRNEVLEVRDKLADDVMKSMEARSVRAKEQGEPSFDEYIIIPSGKESEEDSKVMDEILKERRRE
jgi:hypothetical protein